jgi:hypothetical protein
MHPLITFVTNGTRRGMVRSICPRYCCAHSVPLIGGEKKVQCLMGRGWVNRSRRIVCDSGRSLAFGCRCVALGLTFLVLIIASLGLPASAVVIPIESGPVESVHGMEMPYVFNQLDQQTLPWTPQDRRLASVISAYWTNFAKSGDPNGVGLPIWPSFTPSNQQAMQLGRTIAPGPLPDEADLRRIDRLYQTARFVTRHIRSILTVVALSALTMIAGLIRFVLRRTRRSQRMAFADD